jgi:hypothetical protein
MFLWSFWYIIYIFLIFNKLDMNFLSSYDFLEFLINPQDILYLD